MRLFQNRYQICPDPDVAYFATPRYCLELSKLKISKLYKPFDHRGWPPETPGCSEIDKWKNSKKLKNDPKSTPLATPTHIINPSVNSDSLHNYPLELSNTSFESF